MYLLIFVTFNKILLFERVILVKNQMYLPVSPVHLRSVAASKVVVPNSCLKKEQTVDLQCSLRNSPQSHKGPEIWGPVPLNSGPNCGS